VRDDHPRLAGRRQERRAVRRRDDDGGGSARLDRLRRKLGIVVFDHVTDGRMWSLPEHAPPPDDIAEDGF
jgi:hypothetical protein